MKNTIDQSNKTIISLLCSGMTDKEIAVELQMKIPTINKRIKVMMKRHDCRTRTQLAVKMILYNLTEVK